MEPYILYGRGEGNLKEKDERKDELMRMGKERERADNRAAKQGNSEMKKG